MPTAAHALGAKPDISTDALVIKATMAAARLAQQLPLAPCQRDIIHLLRLAYIEGGADIIDLASGVMAAHVSPR